MKISPALLAPFIHIFYRLWCSTLRIEETGRERLEALAAEDKLAMISIWHDELFALIHVRRELRLVTVVSKSRDGEYLARLLQSLGIKTARGSSRRGGLEALLQAVRIMRNERRSCVITLDGPQGPRHVAKQGAVIVGFRAPAYILPARIFPEKAKVFKSWDRFQLPLPFSKVHIVFGEPYLVSAPALTNEVLAVEQARLEQRLDELRPPSETTAVEKTSLVYQILRFFAGLCTRLSWNTLRTMASVMGFCFWHLVPARRNEAVQAIAKHLQVPQAEAKRIARQSFTENFLSFLEIFHAGKFFTDTSIKVCRLPAGREDFVNEKAPLVFATAHLGSWELMSGLAADFFPDRQSVIVVRSRKNPALNRIMAELRGTRGMLAVNHRNASSVVVPKLRNKGLAAFLVDHNSHRRESVFLPFLADKAAVNMGPASIALRTRAVVYPVFLLRDGQGGHILHVLAPLRTEELEGSVQDRVRQIAAFYTDAVASMVRQYPEQWFWMHRRWKTREQRED